jgi:hypothetical protein
LDIERESADNRLSNIIGAQHQNVVAIVALHAEIFPDDIISDLERAHPDMRGVRT